MYTKQIIENFLLDNYVNINDGGICTGKKISNFNDLYTLRGLEEALNSRFDNFDRFNHSRIIISGWAGSGKTSLIHKACARDNSDKSTCKNDNIIFYYLNFDNQGTVDFIDCFIDNEKQISEEWNETSAVGIKLMSNISKTLDNKYISHEYENLFYSSLISEYGFLNFGRLTKYIEQSILDKQDFLEIKKVLDELKKNSSELYAELVAIILDEAENSSIRLYYQHVIKFLCTELDKKIIFIFDNIDNYAPELQSELFNQVNMNLADTIPTFEDNEQRVKFITAIRLENLLNINIGNNDQYDFFNITSIDFSKDDLLQQDHKEIYRIYTKKLAKIKIIFEEEYNERVNAAKNNTSDQKRESAKKKHTSFINKINNLIHYSNWITRQLPDKDPLSANIFTLSNNSIRIALKVINDFFFWLEESNAMEYKHEFTTVVSYIHSLFYAWISKNKLGLAIEGFNISHYIHSFENEPKKYYHNIKFQILVFLINHKEKFNTKIYNFSNLLENISSYLKIDESKLKGELFELFNITKESKIHELYSNTIFLHNDDVFHIVKSINDINSNTYILIMPRTEELIKTTFKFTFTNLNYLNLSTKSYFTNYDDHILDYIDKQLEMLHIVSTIQLIKLFIIYRESPMALKNEYWLSGYLEYFGFLNIFADEKLLQNANIMEHNKGYFMQLLKDKNFNKSYSNDIEIIIALFSDLSKKFKDESHNVFSYSNNDNFSIHNFMCDYYIHKINSLNFNCAKTPKKLSEIFLEKNTSYNIEFYIKNLQDIREKIDSYSQSLQYNSDKKVIDTFKNEIIGVIKNNEQLDISEIL